MSEKYPNIKRFLELNPEFRLEENGEVGFGRPCVGILYGDSYVYTSHYDTEENDFELLGSLSVPPAENAYHKVDCLCVLTADISKEEALKELDDWIERILNKGFKIEKHPAPKNSLHFLFGVPSTDAYVLDRHNPLSESLY